MGSNPTPSVLLVELDLFKIYKLFTKKFNIFTVFSISSIVLAPTITILPLVNIRHVGTNIVLTINPGKVSRFNIDGVSDSYF